MTVPVKGFFRWFVTVVLYYVGISIPGTLLMSAGYVALGYGVYLALGVLALWALYRTAVATGGEIADRERNVSEPARAATQQER